MSLELFDYQPLIGLLDELGKEQPGAKKIAEQLPSLLETGLCKKRYGDLARWQHALSDLPDIPVGDIHLNDSCVRLTASNQPSVKELAGLNSSLEALIPWRKGPFNFFGTLIDTEWRSDLKWDRVKQRVGTLKGKNVLDVGCGSGYHCWRMAGEEAALAIGIDPTPLFVCQYWAVQKYAQRHDVWVVPARMELLPRNTKFFDTVFSMGVLYHRRSPFDHLLELKEALVEGGQLVLETLVIDGSEGEVLVPKGRYSKMGNVWFLPSVPELCNWLRKLKFNNVDVVDVSVTNGDEQRATEWMRFQSLSDFLDPEDPAKTVEGYPAPRRAIVVANT